MRSSNPKNIILVFDGDTHGISSTWDFASYIEESSALTDQLVYRVEVDCKSFGPTPAGSIFSSIKQPNIFKRLLDRLTRRSRPFATLAHSVFPLLHIISGIEQIEADPVYRAARMAFDFLRCNYSLGDNIIIFGLWNGILAAERLASFIYKWETPGDEGFGFLSSTEYSRKEVPIKFPPNVKLALHTRVGKTRSLNFFARVDKFDSISGERETRETWLADIRDPAWSILVSLRWLITRTRSLVEYDAQFFDTCPDMTVSCTRDYQADENVPAHGIRPP
ncbi:hypothetical protein BDV93DRAFT_507787, partial [Ceratobasidium sp. AG-I]